MGLFTTTKRDFYICDRGSPHLKRAKCDRFNASVLGLGDLTAESKERDAVAAVFDLAGFTRFCNQIDPQLAISEYLAEFIEWLFATVKEQCTLPDKDTDHIDDDVAALATLPFFVKFMGDGVLFLWDVSGLPGAAICALPAIGLQVSAAYSVDFLPRIAFSVSDPPETLRCGMARGKVFSVGNGEDFVGPCINMASRLQKLSAIQTAFARRGFNADKYMDKHMRSHFLLKKVGVRGIGENELVYVERSQFEDLPVDEKALFREPDEEWRMPDDDDEDETHEKEDSETPL
jgi:class 3 adenylate cyclase